MSTNLSKAAAQAAVKLGAALDELIALAADSKLNIPIDELGFLGERLKSARTGFPLTLEECVPQEINRLGSVVLGPVFTSRAHPWPVDGKGLPMAPLCQLNSIQFPQAIEGVEGLVQVWMTQSTAGRALPLIRLVPTADVDVASLSPVIVHDEDIDVLLPEAAEWLKSYHSEPKPRKSQFISAAAGKLGFANAEELEEADWDAYCRINEEYGDTYGEDVITCLQVTGYGEACVYCDITEDQKSAIASLEKLLKKLLKKADVSDEQITRTIANTCTAFKEWQGHLGSQTYPCLLGTFAEIQYQAIDRDTPLICIESIDMREWGDGGNAQVFYSKESGFSFDWSCF